eukprot:8521-Heterococcus_DN1.PRE.3
MLSNTLFAIVAVFESGNMNLQQRQARQLQAWQQQQQQQAALCKDSCVAATTTTTIMLSCCCYYCCCCRITTSPIGQLMQCIQLNTAVAIDVLQLLDQMLLRTHAADRQTNMMYRITAVLVEEVPNNIRLQAAYKNINASQIELCTVSTLEHVHFCELQKVDTLIGAAAAQLHISETADKCYMRALVR